MPEPFRGPRMSRRGWLLAGLAVPLFTAKGADLIVTFDGDNLHVSSLGVHFLQGGSLRKLKDGSTVEYVLSLSLYRDQFQSLFRRSEAHFLVSYDVLGAGDRFAVSAKGPPASRRTNLTQSATEAWCLDRAGIAPYGLAKDAPFWLQLETKTVPPRLNILDPTGLTVNLIEIFTPAQEEKQIHRTTEPLRLMDLKPGRGRAG